MVAVYIVTDRQKRAPTFTNICGRAIAEIVWRKHVCIGYNQCLAKLDCVRTGKIRNIIEMGDKGSDNPNQIKSSDPLLISGRLEVNTTNPKCQLHKINNIIRLLTQLIEMQADLPSSRANYSGGSHLFVCLELSWLEWKLKWFVLVNAEFIMCVFRNSQLVIHLL